MIGPALEFLIVTVAGWLNQRQVSVVEYLVAVLSQLRAEVIGAFVSPIRIGNASCGTLFRRNSPPRVVETECGGISDTVECGQFCESECADRNSRNKGCPAP